MFYHVWSFKDRFSKCKSDSISGKPVSVSLVVTIDDDFDLNF